MLSLTQSILDEQAKLDTKPVFALAIHDYDFPAKPTAIRPNYFNWRCIWKGKHDWWTWWENYLLNLGTGPFISEATYNSMDWPSNSMSAMSFFGQTVYAPVITQLQPFAPAVCATKNDTLIIWDRVTGIHRFANATDGTDFTDWIPEQDPDVAEYTPWSYIPVPECICASPVNDEVIKFWIPNSLLGVSYQISIDDGVTFGATQQLEDIPAPVRINGCMGLWVRAAYKPNGDLGVMVITSDGNVMPSTGFYLWFIERESGAWGSWSNALEINAPDTYYVFPCEGIADQGRRTGLSSCEFAYEPYDDAGDWFFVYSWEAGSGNVTVKSGWAVRGDGGTVDDNVWMKGSGSPNISTAYEVINSFSDIQHFSASGMVSSPVASVEFGIEQNTIGVKAVETAQTAMSKLAAWGASARSAREGFMALPFANYSGANQYGEGTYTNVLERKAQDQTNRLFQSLYQAGGLMVSKDLSGSYQSVKVETVYAYNSVLKVPSGELIWVVQADDKLYFFALRHDMTVREAIFYRAYSIECKQPMTIVASGSYLFGITNNKLYMTVMPVEWTVPTAGTGVGSACTLPADDRILAFRESVEGEQQGKLTIDLDNHDGVWDSPGSGNLANLKKGSRLDLYMGFKIGGSNITYDCTRYIVDGWGYSREPNRSIFKLVCSDGWKLLDEYIIGSAVMYNEFEEEYSAYEVIEKMVNSIGGTLYDVGASAEIKSTYPMINITAGTTAGQEVRKRLKETGDEIRWFGNDAYIRHLQTTDNYVYEYIFPKTS